MGITGYTRLPENDHDALLKAVATVGPISVTVDDNEWDIYESGVFDSCNKTRVIVDHAVSLVGYGAQVRMRRVACCMCMDHTSRC